MSTTRKAHAQTLAEVNSGRGEFKEIGSQITVRSKIITLVAKQALVFASQFTIPNATAH